MDVSHVAILPTELVSSVMAFLDGNDLLNCALIGNWVWYALARDRLPWKRLVLSLLQGKQLAAVRFLHLRLVCCFEGERCSSSGNGASSSTALWMPQPGGLSKHFGESEWGWAEWARAYFAAAREGHREWLASGVELAVHRWRFNFWPESLVVGQAQAFYPTFHADGHYEHPTLFSSPLGWRFVDRPDDSGTLFSSPLGWRFVDRPDDSDYPREGES